MIFKRFSEAVDDLISKLVWLCKRKIPESQLNLLFLVFFSKTPFSNQRWPIKQTQKGKTDKQHQQEKQKMFHRESNIFLRFSFWKFEKTNSIKKNFKKKI